MKPLALASLVIGTWLTAPLAAADNHIVELTTRYGDDAFELGFRSETPLATPRIRASSGFVRVWFSDLGNVELNGDVDGDAIRFVTLRSGYGDTNVAIIRLGDGRTLPLSAITTVIDGNTAYLRIDRAALPAPGVAADEAAAPEVDTTSSDAVVIEENAAEENAIEENAATEEHSDETAASEETEPASPRPELALASPASPLPSTTSPMLMLVLLTVALGLVYLGVRWFGKHRTAGPRREIEIIANKRIGARHQLMVVRALGEDHLLAIHAGRTEKIASMPALDDPPSQGGGKRRNETSDMFSFLKLGSGRRDSDLDDSDSDGPSLLHRASDTPKRIDERPRFGAELLKLVGDRGRGDRVSVGAPPSEAVAGLLRLREKVGR